jgi:hypothetical protein
MRIEGLADEEEHATKARRLQDFSGFIFLESKRRGASKT